MLGVECASLETLEADTEDITVSIESFRPICCDTEGKRATVELAGELDGEAEEPSFGGKSGFIASETLDLEAVLLKEEVRARGECAYLSSNRSLRSELRRIDRSMRLK